MDGSPAVLIILLSVTTVGLLAFAIHHRAEHVRIRNRYKNLIDVDAHLASTQDKIAALREKYGKMRRTYDLLSQEVSLLEENLEDISFGLYKPHYDFDTSEKYKVQLDQVRAEQKRAIREKVAATCSKEWRVGDSLADGRKMVNRMTKLMLRAFNGECDSAVAKVRWNNVDQMLTRVEKAAEAINTLGESTAITISPHYVNLKLQEIRLTHEHEEKRQAEKEEQRQIKEQMREEKKVQQELERAREKAEKEEAEYQKALDRARKEMESMVGEDLERMRAEIAKLERQLDSAHEIKERAISQAQLTRSGHVYVISNIGSFGDTVFKIGMTRRLDPLERVNELGDASVPFKFDVHAIIYSQDAPKLEKGLHKHFEGRRINLVNTRREFFRARIDEIEKVVRALGGDIEFTKLAEAREYRESLAIRKANKEARETEEQLPEKTPAFPATI
ncbi:MAG: DUF4041 domain-containing protein [Candidatus Hydrogenedentes bacterium]|nr:DUF4041 domain-containing protein [Candidatus Hydrogenedentota bacterium]